MRPSQPVTTDDDAIDLVAFTRMLWRYRVFIAATTAVFGVVAVALALLATPIYRAETVVMPAADAGFGDASSSLAGRFGGLASLAGIDLTSSGVARQEAQAVLESRQLVEEFIRRNGLVDEIGAGGKAGPSLWYAVRDFADRVVTLTADDMEGKTTIAVDWKDPVVAAAWANGLVALANELMRTRAIDEANRNIEYLKKQIASTNVVEMQRVMYGLIENETKTLMLANARPDYAFKVIDPAVVPEMRARPKRKLLVVSGLAIGFVLSVLAAFAHDAVSRYRAREAAGAAGRP
jgi:uncharacterized protein involved in exopolysaccharide biosynthesis